MRTSNRFDAFVVMRWRSILTTLFGLFVLVVVCGLLTGCRKGYDPTGIDFTEPEAVQAQSLTSPGGGGGRTRTVRSGAMYDRWLYVEPDWCDYQTGDKVNISYYVDGTTMTPKAWFVFREGDERGRVYDVYVVKPTMNGVPTGACQLMVFP